MIERADRTLRTDWGTARRWLEALAFAAEGKVKADIEIQPWSAINQIFDRQGHGNVPSRAALDFKDT